jgi:hypothetical protein
MVTRYVLVTMRVSLALIDCRRLAASTANTR